MFNRNVFPIKVVLSACLSVCVCVCVCGMKFSSSLGVLQDDGDALAATNAGGAHSVLSSSPPKVKVHRVR